MHPRRRPRPGPPEGAAAPAGRRRLGAINLGNGAGYSVLEVIKTTRRISSRDIPVVIAPRRAGDAVRLIADAGKATTVLGWQPQFPELQTIIETDWAWHSAHPDGYKT